MQSSAHAKAQVHALLSAIRPSVDATIEFWDGERVTYGASRSSFTLRLKDPHVVDRLLANLLIELPDAYVDGDIDIDDGLQDLLGLSYRIDPKQLHLGVARSVALAVTAVRQRNSRAGSVRNVAHHYDLGNDFFRLWLDREMVYSCAYYERPDDDLERAQTQKLEHLCHKLELEAGNSLLDIGCGWGALAIHAARLHGAQVTGITRSEAQAELCQVRIREAGLQDHVGVRLQDYRELADVAFDRVVSVGMMEHVGRSYLPTYIAAVAQRLTPGGIGVLQWISKNRPGEVTPWITLRIFPGMYLPTLAEIADLLAAHDLHLTDAENLRPHYALTLDAWSLRFESARAEVERMYGAPFVRMWRMYLNAASVTFKAGELDLWQVVFTRGVATQMPLTRRHWYESAPVASAGLPTPIAIAGGQA